jgi:putative Mn2+ efflux pump MntP
MSWIDFFMIGIGLSMDAFAVSICKGLTMKKVRGQDAAVIGLFFGGFQALMPFLGWMLGRQFERYIIEWDHWIAFILLVFIGGKMLWDAFHEEADEDENEYEYHQDLKELFTLAIATSIDALAVGITFAFLEVNIFEGITIIGCTTFLLSIIGVYIGHAFGTRFQKQAVVVGGLLLILIGVKILLEHLGILVL